MLRCLLALQAMGVSTSRLRERPARFISAPRFRKAAMQPWHETNTARTPTDLAPNGAEWAGVRIEYLAGLPKSPSPLHGRGLDSQRPRGRQLPSSEHGC